MLLLIKNFKAFITIKIIRILLSFLIISQIISYARSDINENNNRNVINLSEIEGNSLLLSNSYYFIEKRGWGATCDSMSLRMANSIIEGKTNLFKATQRDYINLGLTNVYYWFKIDFKNDKNYWQQRYIKVDSRELAYIEVFIVSNGKIVKYMKGGRFIPVSQRPYYSINHIFPIKFPPSTKNTILIRVYSPLILWITFHTQKSILESEYKNLIPLIIFFGIFIAVFLYNFFLGISLKDKTYFYYLGHTFFLGLFFFLTNGFVSLLFPSLINISPKLILSSPGLSIVFYLLFISSFLETKDTMPKVNKLLIYSIPLFILASFSWLIFDLHFSVMYVIQPLSAFYMMIAIGISIYAVIKGLKSARILLYGTLLYQIGAFITGFVYTGRLPINFFTFHSLQIGFTCELLFLSLALGDKMKRLKSEKEKAERREFLLQQKFSQLALESQEQERKRIAGALHDSIGQDFLIIKNWAELALNKLKKGINVKQQLEEIKNISSNAIEDVRKIAKDLYPYQLEQIGLKNSIEMIIKKLSNIKGLTVTSQIDNIEKFLSFEQKSHIFRIVQEAINNILKHSKATEVSIFIKLDQSELYDKINYNTNLIIKIIDNGIGFDTNYFNENKLENVGMGLSGIRERARILNAKYSIGSQINKGTTINFCIPLHFNKD